MDADCCNEFELPTTVILPFGGHQALATTPEASSSDSDDPELRLDLSSDDHDFCTQDELLARYGITNGVARLEHAEPSCAGDSPCSSGADSGPVAGSLDEDDEDATGSHEDADGAASSNDASDDTCGSGTDLHDFSEAPADAFAHTFAASPTTEPVSSAIAASVDSGASDAQGSVALGGGARSLVGFGSSAGSAEPPRGRSRALGRAIISRRQSSAPARCGCPGAWCRCGWCDDLERSF